MKFYNLSYEDETTYYLFSLTITIMIIILTIFIIHNTIKYYKLMKENKKINKRIHKNLLNFLKENKNKN